MPISHIGLTAGLQNKFATFQQKELLVFSTNVLYRFLLFLLSRSQITIQGCGASYSTETLKPCQACSGILSARGNLLIFEEVSGNRGIQNVSLDIQKLYPDPKEQGEFKDRLCQFLDSDEDNRKVINLEGELLIYPTECIIPNKRDKLIPLLLLLGNPASHSFSRKCFFLMKATDGIITSGKHSREQVFSNLQKKAVTRKIRQCNRSRKNELYELSYKSDFRIGLATFFSMPSGASGSK